MGVIYRQWRIQCCSGFCLFNSLVDVYWQPFKKRTITGEFQLSSNLYRLNDMGRVSYIDVVEQFSHQTFVNQNMLKPKSSYVILIYTRIYILVYYCFFIMTLTSLIYVFLFVLPNIVRNYENDYVQTLFHFISCITWDIQFQQNNLLLCELFIMWLLKIKYVFFWASCGPLL